MAAITIRDVPDDVRNELAARAARSGRSLQEYLWAELTDMASRPSVNDAVAASRQRARLSGTRLTPTDILAARDADRA